MWWYGEAKRGIKNLMLCSQTVRLLVSVRKVMRITRCMVISREKLIILKDIVMILLPYVALAALPVICYGVSLLCLRLLSTQAKSMV
jgi:hypothetical protein